MPTLSSNTSPSSSSDHHPQQSDNEPPRAPSDPRSTPTFSPDSVSVIFVLGGPGSGKGTQCAKLVSGYGFTHLSAGDLLRAEQDRPDSEFGNLIKDYIKEGTIVPMEITVKLLENAMRSVLDEKKKGDYEGSERTGRFLIDGFPRKMDQALHFDRSVCPSRFILFLDCPESVMESRLLNRGKTSGRADDNAESIHKRFRTFVETSMPVVDYFDKELRKLERVSAVGEVDEVYARVKGVMKRKGFEEVGKVVKE